MHKSSAYFSQYGETLPRADLRIGSGGGKPADGRPLPQFAGESMAQLSRPATEVARLLACLDEGADLAMLTALASKPDSVEKALAEALAAGLLHRRQDHYRYAQAALAQAIYQAIPAGQRAGLHLRIGRQMLASATDEMLPAALPSILAQLNRGAPCMPMRAERERCAGLNLRASQDARKKGPPTDGTLTTALAYAASGLHLLDDASWQQHRLRFALARQHTECLLLLGHHAEAGPGLTELAHQAADPADRGIVARLQIGHQAALDRPDRALAIAATELARGGLQRSLPANDAVVTAAIAGLWSELAHDGITAFTGDASGRSADARFEIHLDGQARLDAMACVLALSLRVDQALCLQMVVRSMQASRQPGGGAGGGAALAYIAFGVAAGQRDDCARHAWALGSHGLALAQARRAPEHGAGAASELFFAQLLMPWHAPLPAARQALHAALERALHDCEPLVAVQARLAQIDLAMACGEPLALVRQQIETALQQLHGGFAMAAQLLQTRLALIASLRGEAGADEALAVPPQALAARSHWIQQLQRHYYRGDHVLALGAANAAQTLFERSPPDVEYAACAFYSALCHAALHQNAAPAQRPAHRLALASHQAALARLVRHHPDNFAPMTALLAAEASRIDGREDAGHAYALAIALAVEHKMRHVEALAHELAARSSAAYGIAGAAHLHLRQARDAYLRWGAPGKAAQLQCRGAG